VGFRARREPPRREGFLTCERVSFGIRPQESAKAITNDYHRVGPYCTGEHSHLFPAVLAMLALTCF